MDSIRKITQEKYGETLDELVKDIRKAQKSPRHGATE